VAGPGWAGCGLPPTSPRDYHTAARGQSQTTHVPVPSRAAPGLPRGRATPGRRDATPPPIAQDRHYPAATSNSLTRTANMPRGQAVSRPSDIQSCQDTTGHNEREPAGQGRPSTQPPQARLPGQEKSGITRQRQGRGGWLVRKSPHRLEPPQLTPLCAASPVASVSPVLTMQANDPT
jgi:hypothetical protein